MQFQENATITILFDGLVFLHFSKDEQNRQYCEAWVLRVPEHDFTITITGLPQGENLPDGILKGENLPGGILDGNFMLEVPERERGVSRFISPSFDRTVGGDRDRDFRWVLDLGSEDFHGDKLGATNHHEPEDVPLPALGVGHTTSQQSTNQQAPQAHGIEKIQALKIYHGEFFTAAKYRVTKWYPRSNSHLARRNEVIWVADRVGCNIHLAGNEEARLHYGLNEDGSGNKPPVEFTGGSEAHYEICIENNRRPGTSPQQPLIPRELTHSSDFHHYYDLFKIPEGDQFDISLDISRGVAVPFRNYEYPCDPGTCGCE